MILERIIGAIGLVIMVARGVEARLQAKIENIVTGPMSRQQVERYLRIAAHGVPDAPDWQNSIVDLLKILHLDSSWEARVELATEIDPTVIYTGSEKQNLWLHGKVMDAVANREFNR